MESIISQPDATCARVRLTDNWCAFQLVPPDDVPMVIERYLEINKLKISDLDSAKEELERVASLCAEGGMSFLAMSLADGKGIAPSPLTMIVERLPGSLADVMGVQHQLGVEFLESDGMWGKVFRAINTGNEFSVTYWLEPPDGKGVYAAIFGSTNQIYLENQAYQDAIIGYFDYLMKERIEIAGHEPTAWRTPNWRERTSDNAIVIPVVRPPEPPEIRINPHMDLTDDWRQFPLQDAPALDVAIRAHLSELGKTISKTPDSAETLIAVRMIHTMAATGAILWAFSLGNAARPFPGQTELFVTRENRSFAAVKITMKVKGEEYTKLPGPFGEMIRRVRVDKGVGVDYWIKPGDGKGLYHAEFGTDAPPEQADELVRYFDSLVATLKFTDAPDGAKK